MSRVLSTSVQIMGGDDTPREIQSALGIRLSPVRMNTLDDNSRPNSFLFDGLEFRGWLAPFGSGFGLSLVDGDLPAEIGASHIASKLKEERINVEGVFDMEDPSDKRRFEQWVTGKLVGSSTMPQTPSPRKPGLKARLDAIEAQMPNDRFIKSLQDHLKRRGGLTQNQINAITKIENKLASPQPIDQATIDRINAVLAKMPNGNTFLESLRDQVTNGRSLSRKQLDAIAKFEQPRKSRTRRTRQDGGKYVNLSQFHTWDLYHQLNALAGGHVARALYGVPEMGSAEERIFTLLADVASSSHAQMNTLTRLSALRKILPHLGKHPLLKNLPEDIAKDILRKVIVDGQPWRDDVSML